MKGRRGLAVYSQAYKEALVMAVAATVVMIIGNMAYCIRLPKQGAIQIMEE
jgi:hypothetical protein